MRRQDVLRHDCEVRYDYSIGSAYRSIDRYNDGRIDTYNLGAFLRSHGHYATETELSSIIRRIDTDGDARLSYSEYAEFMAPAGSGASVHPVPVPVPIRYGSPPPRVFYEPPVPVVMTPPRARSAIRRPVRVASPVRGMSPSRLSPVRKPLLHMPEEDQLVAAFKEMCVLERELEQAKTALTLKSDFNLADSFRQFDPHHRGVINNHDIREGLSAIGVFPTTEEIELFVSRYDNNGDRRLNFNEFSDAFTTLDSYYAHMLTRRPSNHRAPLYRRDDCFFADTQHAQRDVWRVHFKCETSSESIRQRLQRMPCFNVYEAFNSMDLNDSGSISTHELRRMLESRGFFASDKEVRDVVDKFDSNKNGMISYAEFREEILPKSPVRH